MLSLISFLSPKRLLIAGLIFSVLVVLLIIEMTGLFKFGITSLSGKLVVLWFVGMYLGGLLLFVGMLWWLAQRKNIYAKWFFRFFVFFLILATLVAGDVIPLPLYCTGTYRSHGDGPNGPVYFDPKCIAWRYPWQPSFWSDRMRGKEISWERFGILTYLWEEGIMDLVDEWKKE